MRSGFEASCTTCLALPPAGWLPIHNMANGAHQQLEKGAIEREDALRLLCTVLQRMQEVAAAVSQHPLHLEDNVEVGPYLYAPRSKHYKPEAHQLLLEAAHRQGIAVNAAKHAALE
jgi:hypothetical protein